MYISLVSNQFGHLLNKNIIYIQLHGYLNKKKSGKLNAKENLYEEKNFLCIYDC